MDHCAKENRKQNPREKANIASILTFSYTGGLFKKAVIKRDLEDADLYEVTRKCNSERNALKFEDIWDEEFKSGKPSIGRLIAKRFGLQYLFFGCLALGWKLGRTYTESYAVSNLVKYFKRESNHTIYDGIFFGAIIIASNIFQTFFLHNYIIAIQQMALQIRTSFSSLIYRKTLKLTPTALAEISLGNIVTLLTKDMYAFQQCIWLVNDMWIGIVQLVFVSYLLFAKVGIYSFVGLGIILAVLPFQFIMGRYVGKLKLAINQKTDERLQVTQEALSAIRIVKIYTWELFVNRRLNDARKREVKNLMNSAILKLFVIIVGVLSSRLAFYFMIMSYIWFGNLPQPELIFYITTQFRELRHTLGVEIPLGLARAAELFATMKRVSRVLNAEELKPKPTSDEIVLKPKIALKQVSVYIAKLPVLQEITLNIDHGLTLISGIVGSGKSSLIKTILYDYPNQEGTIKVEGRVSYASQEPWLFPSSIRQNILFGEEYEPNRYNQVVRACALEYDLSLFDKGDETIVADRGLNLSKGQQARVNLARAVYKQSDIYLLDDSLTALDAHVQDYIFNECIKSFLKDKLVVLVTQNEHHLLSADNVILMLDGRVKSMGKPSTDIIQFLQKDDNLEKDVVEQQIVDEEEEEIKEEYQKLLEAEQGLGKKKVFEEINRKGSVNFSVYAKYFRYGGGILLFCLTVLSFLGAQLSESYSEKLISKWADNLQFIHIDNSTLMSTLSTVTENFTDEFTTDSPSSVWNQSTIAPLNDTAPPEDPLEVGNRTIKLFSIMVFVSSLLHIIKNYLLFDFCRRASLNIHKAMTSSIINGVMSFFDTHFIGNILNRFSQDLNNIDEQLPIAFRETIRVFFSVAGIIILITWESWKFIIPAGVLFTIIAIMRYLYIPTGRSLKRLEAATRSPIIGHLNSTLEGLTTIRAYKAQDVLKDEFDRHQDVFTSAHFMWVCTMRAFGFFQDALCSVFIILVISKLLYSPNVVSAGAAGLIVTQVLQLAGHVQWGVRQWAEMENQMTSVERLLEYTEVKSESKTGVVLKNWPSEGAVKYENVSLTYNNNEQVLKNINFTLNPKEKIGIVGRTGAGKSSIIATLFRLYEVTGRILIDNVDIKTLSLDYLRKCIAIIPQDPVLFGGSLRTNLDPNGIYTDEEIWHVLEKVQIKELITDLDFRINDGGSNFSSGQKQLICLARAIIRKNRIVVLDEATANMDPETDELLHKVIKENFSGCTVFAIAHRLHTILDADKIMVLDRGQIVELDEPMALLENKDGIFYNMVEQSGLLPK